MSMNSNDKEKFICRILLSYGKKCISRPKQPSEIAFKELISTQTFADLNKAWNRIYPMKM